VSSHGDEHAAYDRPGRRSRPRTKDRPAYADAEPGMVVTVDRGRYTVLVEDHEVSAVKARQLGRTGVIVGDRVSLVGDTSGEEGSLARIVAVAPRETVLRRTADDDDPYERPIVANADQLVIVTALADPPPRTGMIDRILVAGFDAGLDPLLCLTKADLASPDELTSQYEPLGVPVQVTSPGADLAPLRAALEGRRSVFVGHSGVGKSTLVNALIPGADRAIGVVNAVTGRGRHTSSAAIALRLPDAVDAWVIDTPGVRSFGLSHVTPQRIVAAFGDLAAVTVDCPRGCRHDATAPECALDVAVADGRLPAVRVESFRRMLGSGQ
jgi:ribosome biogenesis GTPase / thiamine phosphate phosphatase